MDRLGTIPAANRDSKNNDIQHKSYAHGKVIGQYHSNSAQSQCQHILGWLHYCSLTTFQAYVQVLSELGLSIAIHLTIDAGNKLARYVLLAGEQL